MRKSWQFYDNDWPESDKFILSHLVPVKMPGFVPTKKDLMEVSYEFLHTYSLSEIRYSAYKTINSVTFGFPDGSLSPPQNTYSWVPYEI